MPEMEPQEQRFTSWRNPTPHGMRIDIYEAQGRRKRYVVPAGKEVQIPSEYDRAIHDVRDGVIVGGLAPLLEKAIDSAVLHPTLDPQEAARKAALEEAEKAILAKKAADEVLAAAAKPQVAKK
jgi:hypothetical protein